MAVNDSFKKEGAIPFKWEIRPGVPKVYQSQKHQEQQQQLLKQLPEDEEFSFPEIQRKLAPPPAGYCFQPPIEARTASFRSASRSRSDRYQFYSSNLAQAVSVSSSGCFPSPLLSRKNEKHKTKRSKTKPNFEPEMHSPSDLETMSRRSISSQRSLSPFRDSLLSSSFSSYQSTPGPQNNAEWAGFGLF